jgi:hypothetical protein
MEYHDGGSGSSGEKAGEYTHGSRMSETNVSHGIAPIYKNDLEIEKDMEKGNVTKMGDSSSEELTHKIASTEELKNEDEGDDEPGLVKRYWLRYRPLGHAIIWLLVTAYIPSI